MHRSARSNGRLRHLDFPFISLEASATHFNPPSACPPDSASRCTNYHPTNPPCLLQCLRDLDRTSPQFHRRLSTLLGGPECRGVVSSLEGEDLAWLVEYLDNVSLQVIPLHSRSTSRRSSPVFPTLQVWNPRNPYTSSEEYAVLRTFCPSLIYFRTLFSTSA